MLELLPPDLLLKCATEHDLSTRDLCTLTQVAKSMQQVLGTPAYNSRHFVIDPGFDESWSETKRASFAEWFVRHHRIVKSFSAVVKTAVDWNYLHGLIAPLDLAPELHLTFENDDATMSAFLDDIEVGLVWTHSIVAIRIENDEADLAWRLLRLAHRLPRLESLILDGEVYNPDARPLQIVGLPSTLRCFRCADEYDDVSSAVAPHLSTNITDLMLHVTDEILQALPPMPRLDEFYPCGEVTGGALSDFLSNSPDIRDIGKMVYQRPVLVREARYLRVPAKTVDISVSVTDVSELTPIWQCGATVVTVHFYDDTYEGVTPIMLPPMLTQCKATTLDLYSDASLAFPDMRNMPTQRLYVRAPTIEIAHPPPCTITLYGVEVTTPPDTDTESEPETVSDTTETTVDASDLEM